MSHLGLLETAQKPSFPAHLEVSGVPCGGLQLFQSGGQLRGSCRVAHIRAQHERPRLRHLRRKSRVDLCNRSLGRVAPRTPILWVGASAMHTKSHHSARVSGFTTSCSGPVPHHKAAHGCYCWQACIRHHLPDPRETTRRGTQRVSTPARRAAPHACRRLAAAAALRS